MSRSEILTLQELAIAAASTESEYSKKLERSLKKDAHVILILSTEEERICNDLQRCMKAYFAQAKHTLEKNASYSNTEPHYDSTSRTHQSATSFTVIRDEADFPNQDIRSAVAAYTQLLDNIPIRAALSRILTRYYQIEPDFLERNARIKTSNRVLRCMHYDLVESSRKNVTGITSHTDYELYTLIHESRPGLEIYSTAQVEWCSTWHNTEPHLVLMLGDAFRQITNGDFPAAEHRVPAMTIPPARTSLVFFQPLDDDFPLEPLQSRHSAEHALKRGTRKRRGAYYYNNHPHKTTKMTQLEHIMQRDAIAKRRRTDLGLPRWS